MEVEFKPATEADLDFLDEIHTACMKKHVMKVYLWNPQLFRQTFNPKIIEIIMLEKVAVGMVQILKKESEIYLANLLISPSFQNRGIGSMVLKRVINQAQVLGLPIKLQVLHHNRAKYFYERFGFNVMEKTQTHYIMSRSNLEFHNINHL